MHCDLTFNKAEEYLLDWSQICFFIMKVVSNQFGKHSSSVYFLYDLRPQQIKEIASLQSILLQ